MLESFAYTVSHDLRALLRTIRGLTQALLEDCSETLDETGKDYASRILDDTSRMDTLIRDLLEYSRISRSQMRIQPVSLSRAVAEAIEQHLFEADGSKRYINVIKPLADVIGRQVTVVHVLVNLIGNAIKFVEYGTHPVVRIRSEVRAPRVRVWVEDNGIGIPPKHHARIFDVFERLHGIADYPGTGSRFWFEPAAVNRGGSNP